MAGNRGGDGLTPEGEGGQNGEPLGLLVQEIEETSDVSASLFKEMSSEEDVEEVVSGIAALAGTNSDMLGLNGAANADSEGEASGEDGSLFEETDGGDESHYGVLSGDQQLAYGGVSNGDVSVGYVNYSLGGGIRFQTEDVPFIRAARRDLDGPLDGPLASLRRVDDASLEDFGEKRVAIFGELRSKEESSPIAGLCGSFPEGVEAGAVTSLADSDGGDHQDSSQVKAEVELEHVTKMGEGLVVPGEQITHSTTLEEIGLGGHISGLPPKEVEMPLVSGELLVAGAVVSKSSQEVPRKRGRASRELGALLMDARGNGRGRRAAGIQQADSEALALALVGGQLEGGLAVDGVLVEASEGVGNRVEVRMTRSKAVGQLARRNEKLVGSSLDVRVCQDVAAKKTGKRSAARGGRLGWGNGVESCADGGLTAGEGPTLAENGQGEGQTGHGSEMVQIKYRTSEGGEIPKNRVGNRGKKAGGKGKLMGARGEDGILEAPSSCLKESHTAEVGNDAAQDVKACEIHCHVKEVLNSPPVAESNQQDAICNLDRQETDVVEPGLGLELSSVGRRQSNRRKTKATVQPGTTNRKGQREITSSAKDAPEINSETLQESLEVCSSKELPKPLKAAEKSCDEQVGIDALGGGTLKELKVVPNPATRSAKGKSASRRGVQSRARKHLQVSENPVCLGEGSSCRVGDESFTFGMSTDIQLKLENGIKAKELASSGHIFSAAEKCRASDVFRDYYSLEICKSQQGEGADVEIFPVKGERSEEDAFRASILDQQAVVNGKIEGGMELKTKESLPGKPEVSSLSRCVVPDQVVKCLDKATLEADKMGNAVSVKKAGVDSLMDSGPKETSNEEVRIDNCLTSLSDNCRVMSGTGGGLGDGVGSVMPHDSATKREDGIEQENSELRVTEVALNATDKAIGETDTTGAGRSKLVSLRKGRVPQPKKVQSRQGSKAADKGKGRGKTRAKKKDNDPGSGPSLVGEEGLIGMKISPGSRRGKRKTIRESVVAGVVEPNKERVVEDAIEPNYDTVETVLVDPLSCSHGGLDKPAKKAQRRQNGRSTTTGAVSAPKKRRKTGKQQEADVNCDSCTPAMVVQSSHEGPIESLPAVNGGELKPSSRRKLGVKKSEKISTGKKVAESTQINGKSKRVKGPPRSTVRSLKGATIKALSSIKDQAGEDLLCSTKDKSRKSKGGQYISNFLDGSTEHGAICDRESSGLGMAEAAVESASLKEELIGDGAGGCVRLQTPTDFQGGEAVRDLDSGAVGEDVSSGVTEGGENKGSEKCIDSAGAEACAARKSWALCDDCNKWRCIPVELADQIESTNARWSCRENPDEAFGDCSVPQEKSNAEINAELQISEVSVCEEGDDKDAVDSKSMNLGAENEDNKPAVWKLIRRNIFQHRCRKALENDEMMVCQCTPAKDGEVSCGDNCLNRMLSIECVAEQCPCGDACSNQQFQNRTYAPIEMYRCGKKGFGLRVTQNVSKGTFIIEYVGEVLDVSAFEGRQQEYARKGQKHFYFMTLNTNEVIDACSKGNFGRFINHSCDPNCATEKWMVNGEVCIGLFAVRDISKDEEVTFDYNYVRVCGAAAKKCECGSPQCRGFIGGNPLTPRAVVESDSEDDEDLEPVMLENSEDEDAHVNENKLAPCKKPRAEAEFRETTTARTSGMKRKLALMKEKAPSTVKRVKTSNSTRRSSLVNQKGLMLDVGGGRHEGSRTVNFSDVQEKLDDMLDTNGGLRRKRDAAKQYLKLLVLTSASGDNRRDATACSVRDLSLLLEALLKTTSRTVLSDIMNKNGLRMLHNLIKQLRRQWDKTPILRKLIKVLELLASEQLLTNDLIHSSPPCSGMESFSESLFELTRHKDNEVVHMVHRFRNKWLHPRPQLYGQAYKGHEKPFQAQSMQSLSPVMMQQSDQMNVGPIRYQSPQRPKQFSSTQPATGLEASRPSSSGLPGQQGGSLPASLTLKSPACLEDGAASKGDVQVSTKPSGVADFSNLGKADQTNKKTRKRPSRWDAPAKVEKSSKDLPKPSVSENEPDGQGAGSGLSRKQAFSFPMQSQFHGKNRPYPQNFQNFNRASSFSHDAPLNLSALQQGKQESSGSDSAAQAPSSSIIHRRQGVAGDPGPQSIWPSSTCNGMQESARLPKAVMSGQPQMHPGTPAMVASRGAGPALPHPYSQVLAGMVPTSYLPGSGAPTMQMGPPMMSSGQPPAHGSLQQIPVSNAIQFGGPPLPAGAFPGGPPLQMGLVASPAQAMHGVSTQLPMGTVPSPIGYPVGPRMSPMLPAAPYVQWHPQLGPTHFAVGPPFPPQRHSLPPTGPLKKLEDVTQRHSTFGEMPVTRGNNPPSVSAEMDMEPEPPVPGLSPPHVQLPGQVNCTGSDLYGRSDIQHMSGREYRQEGRVPLNYGMIRGRELGHDRYGLGNSDVRGETAGFHLGDCWETPESEGFREDVYAMVMSQIQKHKLRTKDLERFCSKLADVIVRKEVAKYVELRNQGSEKIITKSKLAEKVESYVDNQVEIYLTKTDRSRRS